MIIARANLLEAAGRRDGLAVIVTPPTGQGVVGLQGAGVILARADLLEAAGRRGGLAVIVISPAGQGVVCLQGAAVESARTDLPVNRVRQGLVQKIGGIQIAVIVRRTAGEAALPT